MCKLPEFKVLAEHTPLLPNIGYMPALAMFRGSSTLDPIEFYDELSARGAGKKLSNYKYFLRILYFVLMLCEFDDTLTLHLTL